MFWNIKIICKQASINGILGIAIFLIILTGGIDVSIGANLALQCVIVGHLTDWNVPLMAVFPIVLCTGAFTGFLMGILVTKVDIPDLIVTLAAQNLIRGIALILSQKTFNFFPDLIIMFGAGTICDIAPWAFIWFIIVAFLMWIFLSKTRFGRSVYAVGDNKEAAVMCGIDVGKVRRRVYMISGMLVSIAAILYCGMYKSVTANKIGIDTINALLAIVLLGGADMRGGRGSILGVMIGAITIAIINNGMILAKSTDYWITAITGMLILISLLIQYAQNYLKLRSKMRKNDS
jgi:ribose/xylose/arabinose/galactoside ABC-type transport system permease subunit